LGIFSGFAIRSGQLHFVFANAALHHMRDIPAAISEMLRVLRPGGYLISTCDPLSGEHEGEELELRVFNRHPDVLLGVNERIPRLAEFVEAIERHRKCVSPELLTHALYNAIVDGRRQNFISDMHMWDYEANIGMLRQTSGSLAMRIRLDTTIADAARVQSAWAIRVADLAHWMTSQAEAWRNSQPSLRKALLRRLFPALAAISCNSLMAGYLRPGRIGVKPIAERAGI
jgi:SAM-dependent methyltransferase